MENTFGLSVELYSKFIRLHDKHFNAWESEERREQHSLKNIKKLKYDTQKGIFYVYYKATEHFDEVWYHYDTEDGTWW